MIEIVLGIFVVACLVERYILKIGEVNRNIDEIDYKGYFEVDDEVGQVFKQIKEEVNSLEELTEEGALDAKES